MSDGSNGAAGAVTAESMTLEGTLALAASLREAGDAHTANDLWTQMVGQLTAVHEALALLELRRGNSRDASTLLEAAAMVCPEVASLRVHAVKALIAAGAADEALDHAVAATALDPGSPISHDALAAAAFAANRLDVADRALRAGLALDDTDPRRWANLAAVLQDGGCLAEAIGALERACALGVHPGHRARLQSCEAAYRGEAVGAPTRADTGMFDYSQLFARYNVQPRGVVHIGAHEGEELAGYVAAGAERVLFVEGDPDTFARLAARMSGVEQVACLQALVSDVEGVATFHRMSSAQSSSLLALGRHAEIYPSITEVEAVALPTTTLDRLLDEERVDRRGFNVLAIDVQGAELHVLRGAVATLPALDAIVAEVNYDHLYQGCPLIHEIDAFLEGHGFRRVEETRPYHPTWGDALYVRRPTVTMSTLGANGRFGNQIFQYFALDRVARRIDGRVETPPWIGEEVFDLPAHRPTRRGRPVRQDLTDADPEPLLSHLRPFESVDLWGYFQHHTRHLVADRDRFRSLFAPRPEIKSHVDAGLARLRSRGRTLVALHLRRGDYGRGRFYVAPSRWYLDALEALWPELDAPYLYIASDDLPATLGDFARFAPATAADLALDVGAGHPYVDFYVMTQASVLAISNSTYSFVASMLSSAGAIQLRPDPDGARLVRYDPWDSDVLIDPGAERRAAPTDPGSGAAALEVPCGT